MLGMYKSGGLVLISVLIMDMTNLNFVQKIGIPDKFVAFILRSIVFFLNDKIIHAMDTSNYFKFQYRS